jgi:phosphate transport system permease protein
VLPIQIFNLATRPQEGFRTLGWAAIIVLLAILLLMNSVAIAVRNRYQKRW